MSIRIIAGKFKRKQLARIDGNIEVRPILARVRKSLFDILRPRLEGARFLDLFAGSGAVGIEALSRGAASAVFIDMNRSCISLVKKNIEQLGMTGSSVITQSNILDGLDWLRYKNLAPFDIIFLGPPYPDLLVTRTLTVIRQADILGPEGIIIAQHHKRENIEAAEFELFRQKKYGDTMLSFFRAAVPAATAPEKGTGTVPEGNNNEQ